VKSPAVVAAEIPTPPCISLWPCPYSTSVLVGSKRSSSLAPCCFALTSKNCFSPSNELYTSWSGIGVRQDSLKEEEAEEEEALRDNI
jgi:hypothetical protein